jgi:hypothetical protein
MGVGANREEIVRGYLDYRRRESPGGVVAITR